MKQIQVVMMFGSRAQRSHIIHISSVLAPKKNVYSGQVKPFAPDIAKISISPIHNAISPKLINFPKLQTENKVTKLKNNLVTRRIPSHKILLWLMYARQFCGDLFWSQLGLFRTSLSLSLSVPNTISVNLFFLKVAS